LWPNEEKKGTEEAEATKRPKPTKNGIHVISVGWRGADLTLRNKTERKGNRK